MQNPIVKGGLIFFVAMILAAVASPDLLAQEYPTKPVNLIIPLGPGGGHDLTARAVTPTAPKYLGQPIVIHHRPGGGGAIGSLVVAHAKPDGYTLLFGGVGPNCSLPAIEKDRSAGPDDLAGICQVAASPNIVVARPDAPFKNLKQMVEWAKANPDRLVVSTSGVWGAIDIGNKMIMAKTGITARIAHYEGGGPAILSVLGGHGDICQVTPYTGLQYVKAGKLLPLGILDTRRHPDYPDVLTGKEQGVDVVWMPWISLNAPKGTPPAIIKKLADAFKKMIEDEATQEMVKKVGVEPRYLGTDDFVKGWRAQFEEFKELVRRFKN